MLSNLNKKVRSILLISFSILFVGCTSNMKELVNNSKNNKVEQEIISHKLLSNSELPIDIKLSVNSLVLKMRGKSPKSSIVRYDPNGTHIITEDKFKYDNFVWSNLNIMKYNILSKDNSTTDIELVGVLSFKDIIGRFTSPIFHMNYQIKNKKSIIVKNSYIVDNFISKNMTKAYIVPLDKFRGQKNKLKDFVSLFKFAKANAIRMNANEKEIESYNKLTFFDKLKGKYPNNAIKGEFVMMIFCMERFPENYKLILEPTNAKNLKPKYLNDNGWQMGLIPFKGEARSLFKPFTVKVFYKKDKSYIKNKLAEFNNKMNYSRLNSNLNVISNAKLVLNMKNKQHVKLIQMRLGYLKYYNGKLDGVLTNSLKESLLQFNKNVLNVNSDKWSVDTQKALFKGTNI